MKSARAQKPVSHVTRRSHRSGYENHEPMDVRIRRLFVEGILSPKEKVVWYGFHSRFSDMKMYVGSAIGVSTGLYVLSGSVAAVSLSPQNYSFWFTYLFILLFLTGVLIALVQAGVYSNRFLLFFQYCIVGVFSVMFFTFFLSLLFLRIQEKYTVSVPEYAPEEYQQLANLSLSSVVFFAIVMFAFIFLSALKSEFPRPYRRNVGIFSAGMLGVGLLFFIKPEMASVNTNHTFFSLFMTLYASFLIVFSTVLFFFLLTKKTTYVLTDKRMVVVKEEMGREVWIRNYNEITRAKARQGFLGRMFDYGDLIVFSSPGGNRRRGRVLGREHVLYIHGVPSPFVVENIIYNKISHLRR